VDLVAVADDGPLLLGECKWSTRAMDLDVLEGLRQKAAAVAADLEGQPSRVDFALFSRAGFTRDLQSEAGQSGVLLATVEDVLGVPAARSGRPSRRAPRRRP